MRRAMRVSIRVMTGVLDTNLITLIAGREGTKYDQA